MIAQVSGALPEAGERRHQSDDSLSTTQFLLLKLLLPEHVDYRFVST
jgi:hypothetical protein